MIDNRFNIYLRYGAGGFSGKKILQENNYISPSVYANYKNLTDYSFKGLTKTGEVISFGLGFDYTEASDWALLGYNDYNNSSIKLYSFSPIIQFHNRLKESGFLNRIRTYVEIAPTVGVSNLLLTNPLFDIQSNGYLVSAPLKSNNIFYGAKGEVGFELFVTHYLGLCASYAYNYNLITSKFYNDNHFSDSQFLLGVFVRCIKDKRFYY
jgi:hypothetical protein